MIPLANFDGLRYGLLVRSPSIFLDQRTQGNSHLRGRNPVSDCGKEGSRSQAKRAVVVRSKLKRSVFRYSSMRICFVYTLSTIIFVSYSAYPNGDLHCHLLVKTSLSFSQTTDGRSMNLEVKSDFNMVRSPSYLLCSTND